VLDAETGKGIAEAIQYATPNKAAKVLMPEEYRNNPAIFPPADVIGKSETDLYLGEEATRLRSEIWTRIQSA
jgi:spermidine/putrescine transport system substrate-binding protein